MEIILRCDLFRTGKIDILSTMESAIKFSQFASGPTSTRPRKHFYPLVSNVRVIVRELPDGVKGNYCMGQFAISQATDLPRGLLLLRSILPTRSISNRKPIQAALSALFRVRNVRGNL